MHIEKLGPYRIDRKLGRGGMGTVYAGVSDETGEPAAIKLLSAALADDTAFRTRFETEIDTLRKLKHPNIVRLFGFGEQDGLLFYAMELVDGPSLEQELGRGRTFSWREVARIGIETCGALRHAHDRGVIHRDLKPGNLLLDEEEHVKLSDFGIARLFGTSGLTGAGNVLGTAEYMAPEQAGGRTLGPQADLYSLGAVLYVLLARRPLFRAPTLKEVLHKQQFDVPEPIEQVNPDVPKAFGEIIAQLLQKDPESRVPNAALLARQLEAMVHGLTIREATGDTETQEFAREDQQRPFDAEAPTPPAPLTALPEDSDEPPDGTDRSGADAGEADLFAETRATAAFQRPEPAETDEPDEAELDEPRPARRFTKVDPEELDRMETVERRTPWISLGTWVLAAALLGVGGLVWYVLQPPSADALYRKIAANARDGRVESLLEVEDEIREFLTRFPEDRHAEELEGYSNEIDLYRLERQFERRARTGSARGDLLPIERAYLEAISYARLDPSLGLKKLQAVVDLYGGPNKPADRAQDCLELAQRRLERLQEKIDSQAEADLRRLGQQLDRADALRQTDPDRARAMYRAVVELYGDKPWAAEAVRRAEAGLQQGTDGPSQTAEHDP